MTWQDNFFYVVVGDRSTINQGVVSGLVSGLFVGIGTFVLLLLSGEIVPTQWFRDSDLTLIRDSIKNGWYILTCFFLGFQLIFCFTIGYFFTRPLAALLSFLIRNKKLASFNWPIASIIIWSIITLALGDRLMLNPFGESFWMTIAVVGLGLLAGLIGGFVVRNARFVNSSRREARKLYVDCALVSGGFFVILSQLIFPFSIDFDQWSKTLLQMIVNMTLAGFLGLLPVAVITSPIVMLINHWWRKPTYAWSTVNSIVWALIGLFFSGFGQTSANNHNLLIWMGGMMVGAMSGTIGGAAAGRFQEQAPVPSKSATFA